MNRIGQSNSNSLTQHTATNRFINWKKNKMLQQINREAHKLIREAKNRIILKSFWKLRFLSFQSIIYSHSNLNNNCWHSNVLCNSLSIQTFEHFFVAFFIQICVMQT